MTSSTSQVASQAGSAVRVPDFFIVGHPKCGTSALYVMLRQHPQIFMPAIKEPRFFVARVALALSPAGGRQAPAHARGLPLAVRGARAEQRMGEASPTYLRSERAAERIAGGRAAAPASSRSCVSPPASCALFTCSACTTTSSPRTTSPRRWRWSPNGGDGRRIPPLLALAGDPPLLRPRALRRAAAPLSRPLPGRARARPDLRRLPRGQRGDGEAGAALPGRRRRGADPDRCRPARLPACAASDCMRLRAGSSSLAATPTRRPRTGGCSARWCPSPAAAGG